MLKKTRVIKSIIFLIILTAGMSIGAFAFASANAYLNRSLAPAPNYPKNEFGQTYGSGLDATSLDTEPVLMKAYGIDGTLGYVKSADLNGVQPKTPKEALAQQAKVGSVRKIPLYDIDGKTVIGVFNITTEKGIEQAEKAN